MEENLIRSENVREYVAKFKIEEVITKAINEMVKELPKDPFAFLCSIMKENSTQVYTLANVQLRRVLRQDFQKFLELIIKVSYQGNEMETMRYLMPFSNTLYDKIKDNLELVIEVFNTSYKDVVCNYQIENFENYDTSLKETTKSLPEDDPITKSIGAAIANALSITSFISMSRIREESLVKFVMTAFPQAIVSEDKIPNLGFSLFKTGKSVNSKVKFERFIIFIDNSNKIPKVELFELIQKLYATIRKYLTAGKQGENGLKLNNEGSYSPPVDNMNEIIKLLETIINEVNAPERLYYGIDCNANNFYNDKTKIYEMDGFKKPPDSDQLIDFYQKMCNDHPLLKYFEEPMAQADVEGWAKIKQVFGDNLSEIIISNKCYKEPEEVDPEKNNINSEPKESKHHLETMPQEDHPKTEANQSPNEEEEDEGNDALNVVSCRFGQLDSISELLYTIQRFRLEGDVEINLWDNEFESEQSAIIEIGLGFRVNHIILNGFSMKNEKMCKIIQYINLIEELY